MPSPTETLACWLLHASAAGPDGRLIPTASEMESIFRKKPERWEEAMALAETFVRRTEAHADAHRPPPKVLEAALGFAGAVQRANESLGGLLSAPPSATAPKGGTGRGPAR